MPSPHRLPVQTACRAIFNEKRDITLSMQSAERQPFPHRRGLIIVTTLATAYVASHFFRAANVTIGLDLMRDLPSGRKRWAR